MKATIRADDNSTISPGDGMFNSGRQDWLAHIGHELRSPVTNILAQIEALQHGVFGPMSELQKQSLSSATTSVERLMEVITDVLDLNQTALGHHVLAEKDCCLEKLCRHGFNLVQEYAVHRGVKMTLEVAKEISIRTDPRYFRQLIAELLLAVLGSLSSPGCLSLKVTCVPEIQGLCITLHADSGNTLRVKDAELLATEKLVAILGGDIHCTAQSDLTVITTLHLPNCRRV